MPSGYARRLPRDAAQRLGSVGIVTVAAHRDVAQRQDADQTLVVVDHRQAPDLMSPMFCATSSIS